MLSVIAGPNQYLCGYHTSLPTMSDTEASLPSHHNLTAFLLSWDGSNWRDVVRLCASEKITIGRADTNTLVLHDDACSRVHCELLAVGDTWIVKDLSSRNGTQLNREPVESEMMLKPQDIISIGNCHLAFTNSLENTPRFPDSTGIRERDTATGRETLVQEPPAILARSTGQELLTDGGISQLTSPVELARLYKLGLNLGASRTRQQLTEVVLESLVTETVADISAVLLVNGEAMQHPTPTDLQVVGYHSRKNLPYRRVSDNLSRVVLTSREAVLARVADDRQLAVFDSLGEMRAISVICAPICCEEKVHGLIHLYSTNVDNPLDKHDLEFTLAVTQQFALAIDHLSERDSLQSGLEKARNQNQSLRQHVQEEIRLIGESSPMVDLRERIELIADTDANVLIRGESGCGKELIARKIHLSSRRTDGPFVCMNCAALNESLLESELFGHEKGSFTGASEKKIGRFEQADNGTLFLDEVGEMSLSIQAKFLRVLEGHPFERVGGNKQIQADVRLLAATNRDLEEAVEEGTFRKDLYFRLHVAELIAAPLRQRRSDIALLAEFFLQKFVGETGRLITGFEPDAIQMLEQYEWPGNVRELQNTIERTVILCRNESVRASDIQLSTLSARLAPNDSPTVNLSGSFQEQSLADLERRHILATLDHTEWNKSRAAQILGIERSTLDRKLKRYQVSRP